MSNDSQKSSVNARPDWPYLNRRGEPEPNSIENIKTLLRWRRVRLTFDVGHHRSKPQRYSRAYLYSTGFAGLGPFDGIVNDESIRAIWALAQEDGLRTRWGDFRRIMWALIDSVEKRGVRSC